MVLIDSISIPTTFHQPCAMRRRVLREGAWAGPTVRRRGTAVAAAPATSATAGAATAATTTAAAAAAAATVVMSLLAILPPFEFVRIFPHFSFLVLLPQHCKCVLRRTLARHLRTHAHRPPASFPFNFECSQIFLIPPIALPPCTRGGRGGNSGSKSCVTTTSGVAAVATATPLPPPAGGPRCCHRSSVIVKLRGYSSNSSSPLGSPIHLSIHPASFCDLLKLHRAVSHVYLPRECTVHVHYGYVFFCL